MRYERSWRFFGTAAVVIILCLGMAAFMFIAYDSYGWARLSFVDWGMYGAMNLGMLGVVIVSLASIYLAPKSIEISSDRRIIVEMFSGKRFVLDNVVSYDLLPGR
ncbi:MAG: hypothetical protein PHF60_04760, partial [Candidatus ainarchaeum sp.]|nr:hypothetical protein [Candidatus ainarchaeum sp.]